MANEITKTAICDSCNQEKVVTATPHHQTNNPVLYWYCESCKFAHDAERGVQELLQKLAVTDPNGANDSATVAKLHEQVVTQLLTEKAQNGTLPANEEIVSAEPSVQEAEVVESTPATESTPETVPSEETPQV